jgi:hypothetical protein
MVRGDRDAILATIPMSYTGKARSTIISEHNDRVVDSLGICNWPYILQMKDEYYQQRGWNKKTGGTRPGGCGRGPYPGGLSQ